MTNATEPMLRSIKDMIGYPIDALDGKIGRCDDFLFDDEHWTIRYLVADTGKWLPDRKILVSPCQFGNPDLGSYKRHFPVNMTCERIEKGPSLDTNAPVSRRHELEMAEYHHYHPYWVGPGVWGGGAALPTMAAIPPMNPGEREHEAGETEDPDNSQLRSANEVIGYHVSARDGEIGHVEDFIVETTSWTIRWLVIDTRNWLPGRKVLISPDWFTTIELAKRSIGVDLKGNQVKNSPIFHPHCGVNRDYEGQLYDYYGRPSYW